jgi:hypothetical protein
MRTALGTFTACSLASCTYSQPMLRFRYNRRPDFLFRSALEHLHRHPRPQRIGAGAKDITARAGKTGGENDGGSEEHASVIASQIRWSGINASRASDDSGGKLLWHSPAGKYRPMS